MPDFTDNNFDKFRIKLNSDVGREKALEEALKLLNQSNLTSDDAVHFSKKQDKRKLIKDIKSRASGSYDDADKLDTIIDLLQRANFSSEDAVKIEKKREYLTALFLIFMGIGTILAGVLIIVVDPDMLKGTTIFYFNPQDGITLSDLMALLLIGVSSFFFVWSYAMLQKR